MREGDWFTAMFSVNKRLDVFHRSWAVEGNHCSDVTQIRGLQGFDVPLHTSTFELEQVVGISG